MISPDALIRQRRRIAASRRAQTGPPTPSGPLTLVTLNTWKCDGDYFARLERMAALLTTLDADLVLLQEVFACPPESVNTAFFLGRHLNLFAAYHPAREKRREFQGRSIGCQSGMAILSRRPITQFRALPLPSDPADGDRIAQLARIAGLDGTLFANVHLTHLTGRTELRRRQFSAVLGAAMPQDGTTLIAAGDFNDWVDAAWLEPVAAESGMSVRNLRGRPSPSIVDAPTGVTGAAARPWSIDHVIVAGEGDLVAGEITHHGDLGVSDHQAVCVDLDWDISF